jgi:hypothetical protein
LAGQAGVHPSSAGRVCPRVARRAFVAQFSAVSHRADRIVAPDTGCARQDVESRQRRSQR